MKKINLIQILFTFVLMNLCKNGYGQFTAATQQALNLVNPIAPYNIGNDVYDDGSYIFKVSAWSELYSAGIAWDVYDGSFHNTSNTTFAHSTNIDYADVALVKDQNGMDYYAVAVWHATTLGSGGWYIEPFLWNGSAFGSTGATALDYGYFGTTLHIDAESNGGYYTIVWDNTNNDVYCVVGQMSGGPSYLSYAYPGYPLRLVGANAIYPDACIYPNGGNDQIDLTYIDLNGDLNVESYDIGAIQGGSGTHTTPISAVSPPHGYYFNYPRIACPNMINSTTDTWTVVVAETDHNSHNYIDGYNSDNGTVSSAITYNDGSGNSPLNITRDLNELPVVTYDDQYTNSSGTQGVWVAWVLDNLSGILNGWYGVASYARYPITLKCDPYAVIPSSSTYWEVPIGVTSYVDYDQVSIAGRYAINTDSLLFTYHDSNAALYEKAIAAATASSLKSAQQLFSYDSLLAKDIETSYTLQLIDLNGRCAFNEHGDLRNVINKLKMFSDKISFSVYLSNLISDNGGCVLTKKVCIGKQ